MRIPRLFAVFIGCLLGLLCAGIIPGTNRNPDAAVQTNQANSNDQKHKTQEEELKKSPQIDYWVDYRADGAYLVKEEKEVVAGPYRYIEDVFEDAKCRRFTAANSGLIGYMSFDGSEIVCEPVFTEAEALVRFGTRVSEGDGYYYISEDGSRITSSAYRDGSPYYEHQDSYCRVKLDNDENSWAVIDREQRVLVQGYSKINPLPEFSTAATGVKDGKAVVFYLDQEQTEAWREITLDEYSDIEPFAFFDTYAVVSAGQSKGVINGQAKTVVPPKYKTIEITEHFPPAGSADQAAFQYVIKAQTYEGSWDVFWNP